MWLVDRSLRARGSSREWLELAGWLLLIGTAALAVFACGQLALLGGFRYTSADTDSRLRADYGAWAYQVIPAARLDILDAIEREEGLAPTLVNDSFWPAPSEPGATPPSPTAEPTSTQEPARNAPSATSTPRPTQTGTSTLAPTRTPSQTPSRMPTASATSTARPTETPSPVNTAAPRPSQTPWPTASHTPSPTRTSTATPTPTRTYTPSITPTSTSTPTPTLTPTPTATSTSTPTDTLTPSITPTASSTPTPSDTPSPTATSTATGTSTPTDTATSTATNTSTPTPTPTPTPSDTPTATTPPTISVPACGGSLPGGEPNMGLPNGVVAEVPCGTYLDVDLDAAGSPRITSHAGYDFVYYERGGCAGICFDWVIVQVSEDASTWLTVLDWGDGAPDGNTNVAAHGADGEDDNESIPMADLHLGSTPGIEIDVDFLGAVPAGGYRYIRVWSPLNWPNNDGSDVDSIEVLP